MGQRKEPRTEITLSVRIFGTDADGKVFSENVSTVDVSSSGAKLKGVRSRIKPGEIIGITYGKNKGRFQVKWAGQAGTPQAGSIGVSSVTPDKCIWDISLPPSSFDSYARKAASDRRTHPRMKCVNSVQLQPEGQAAPIWGKAVDLSGGGCFVEMPIPLKPGTKLKIGLWVNENKLQFKGEVVNSRPGFGIGIRFTEISDENATELRKFIKSITQIPSSK